MTRFTCMLGCCLAVFALITDSATARGAEPAAEKKAEAAEKKVEAAKNKPEAAEKKVEAPAGKPQPKPKPKPTAAETPATYKVEPGLVKTEVSLKGTFEARSATEMVLRPKAWSSFKVLKAVAHGAKVERGDVLVKLDMEDIDEAIVDSRRKVELAELAIKLAEQGLKTLEATTPLDLASAERSKRYAHEDLDRYLKIDRAMSERIANFNVETSKNYLEYEQEELRQLEKMYKADDLTEETEEIILKRQRDAVKRAEFYLKTDEMYRDQTLNITLPRRDVTEKESAVRADLSLDGAKATLPLALTRSRLDLDKLKAQYDKEKERLDELEKDRAMMSIKAPTEGIVYYGRFKDGEWSGASSAADKLRPFGSITPNDVFITIVKPRPMVIRVKLPEKNLHEFRPGLKGTARPTGYPDMRLPATVTKISAVPFTAGNFQAELRLSVPEEDTMLVPGMSCTVKFIPYLKKRALTVPPSAVYTDEIDDQKHYVMLVDEDGKQRKQSVTLGKKAEDKVEILDGLVAGDQVLKEFPKDRR